MQGKRTSFYPLINILLCTALPFISYFILLSKFYLQYFILSIVVIYALILSLLLYPQFIQFLCINMDNHYPTNVNSVHYTHIYSLSNYPLYFQ